MSGADDLRTAVADAVWLRAGVDYSDAENMAAAVMACLAEVLPKPENRLAILDAMVLDVTDGWDVRMGIVYTDLADDEVPPASDRVLVVRPRGEATDA